MKVSYNWLKGFLPALPPVEETVRILTSIGLEVDGYTQRGGLPHGGEGLVVGRVLTCEQHPNADRLHITKVDIGGEAPLSIVCGAPNVAQGQNVVVATVGTTLYPLEGESFKIKRSKLRGELSEGMLCAEDEIGLSPAHDGIMVLPEGLQPGTPAAEALEGAGDWLIEIGLTANRADAMSHHGVARDLSAYLRIHGAPSNDFSLHLPDMTLPKPVASDGSQPAVRLGEVDAGLCERYCGVTIAGIRNRESPAWLVEALGSLGVHSINAVVDVTNYVLFAFGQPLHAFDARAFTSGSVSVRCLPQGVELETLDGKKRSLDAADLTICNAGEPLCLAGVFGGAKSGVTMETTAVFLEAAVFNSVSVRRTARRHALNTEASFRFERGVDPTLTPQMLAYAARLIVEICGGSIVGEPLDFYPSPRSHQEFDVSVDALSQRMGIELTQEEVESFLACLEIESHAVAPGILHLRVPRYRVDVVAPEDITEELLRMVGYDAVPVHEQVHFAYPIGANNRAVTLERDLVQRIAGMGFQEIKALSLVPGAHCDAVPCFPSASRVRLLNPLSADLDTLRPSLVFGMLDAAARNAARQREDMMLFELGDVFARVAPSEAAAPCALKGYDEHGALALLLMGAMHAESWLQPRGAQSLFTLKGYVMQLLSMAGVERNHLEYAPAPEGLYSAGVYLQVGKEPLVHFGELHPELTQRFDLKAPAYYAEFRWEALVERLLESKYRYEPVPRFPAVRRDLALLLDCTVPFHAIERIAFEVEPRLLTEVNLFDVYEGKGIPEGKRSYAVSFMLQDRESTLNDARIDGVMQRLLTAFTQRLGAQQR